MNRVCTCWRLRPDGSHGKGCMLFEPVAESNHTTTEGGSMTKQRGTLKSKQTGREIEGVVKTGEDSQMHHILLDPEGSASQNNFPKDLWEFKPDLPTQPGLYTVYAEDSLLNNYRRLLLTTQGSWFWVDFTVATESGLIEFIEDPQGALSRYEPTLVYSGTEQ
jgi:hypothetical protein